jgi:hypothetical protein
MTETVVVNAEREVHLRGVNVLVNDLPDLREAIAALDEGARSPHGFLADERHEFGFQFLTLAAQAGSPVPRADYPKLIAELDALIEEHHET